MSWKLALILIIVVAAQVTAAHATSPRSTPRRDCNAEGGAYVLSYERKMICKPKRDLPDEGALCESDPDCSSGRCLAKAPLDVAHADERHIGMCSGSTEHRFGCFDTWVRPGEMRTLCVDPVYPFTRDPPAEPERAGWYGFAAARNLDRDDELHAHCASEFVRVDVPEGARTPSELCASIGLHCQQVCDWGGTSRGCDELPDPEFSGGGGDGTRITFCAP